MARFGVQCDSGKGNQFACGGKGLWKGGDVTLATLVGTSGGGTCLRIPCFQIRAAPSCGRCATTEVRCLSPATATNEGKERENQHHLSRNFFQNHTGWGDDGHHYRDSQLPDFRHKESGELLSPWSPADQLVGEQLGKSVTPESVKKLCQQGQVKEALEILELLSNMNSGIDKYLLYSVLKERAVQKDVVLGAQLRALAVKTGLGSDTFLCNHFIRMYTGQGNLEEAMDVFTGVAVPDAFMWSSIITAHVKQGQPERAVELYRHGRAAGAQPDAHVLVAAVQACAAAGDLQSGKQMHDDAHTCGLVRSIFVCNCLVDMYAKCGSLKDARRVFDGLHEKKDVVTWSAMIAGYARVGGMGQEALNLYSAMHSEGMVTPNATTFVCLLQACANLGASALETGKQIHSQVKDRRLESNVVVGGSLVNMYVKCGSLEDAQIVFDRLPEKNVVTWTAMISGYAQKEGMGQDALSLYSAMPKQGLAISDAVAYVCLLHACANVGVSALETGKQLHSQLTEQGLETDLAVGGSLVNMYAKCGSLKAARTVFDRLGDKDVVIWTAMIAGYAQQENMGQEALNIYSAMRSAGTATPDAVTFVCLLEACTNVGALQQGKQLHSEICKGGFESNVQIGASLVKMYAKCGCLKVSREVFDRQPMKDLLIWNALLKGYSQHGEASMAIQCFEELLEHGIQPNEATYTCLFTACSHAGLVDLGQQYFKTMVNVHRIEPNEQHYCCMVDLLGRSGHLDRAEHMLRTSGVAGNAVSWITLLSACKSYGDAEVGRRCFDHLVKLRPAEATAYVLLGSIYANAGRWDEVESVEDLRRAAGASKVPGKACIEVKRTVHEFIVGEKTSDVAATLRKMNTRVKEGGHVPQTQLVLRAVSEQEKEDSLCGHAEKLALAYGLLNTAAGSTLVVTKNLRMCNDCHSSTKIMSRLEKREIVVRDCHKVHRFQNGACSCQDRP